MIYLASPYSHPDPAVRQRRFEAACRATARMIRDGRPVFCPVVHSHPLTRYGLPGDWRFWERYDRVYMAASQEFAILALDGWKESRGIRAEVRIARELGMPFWLIDPVKMGIRTESAPAAGTGAPRGAM